MDYRPLTADLRAAAEDFAGRIPLRDRGFLDPFLLYQVAVASWTQATPARRIAAIDDEAEGAPIVGLVTVVPHGGWQSHVGDFRIVVDPAARGRGVGGGLIARGIELARELGLAKVTVEIMSSNDSGRAIFGAHGFREEAVLQDQVRDGDGALQDMVIASLRL